MNVNPNSPYALATRLATALWWEIGEHTTDLDGGIQGRVELYRPQMEYVDARSRVIKIWLLEEAWAPCCVIATQDVPDGPWDESLMTWEAYPMKRARWRFEPSSPTDDCGSDDGERLDVDNAPLNPGGVIAVHDCESESKYWHRDHRCDCDNLDDIPF